MDEKIKQDEERLHELSLIPKTKRTPEETKEYARLHTRKSRRRLSTDAGWKKLFDRAERANTQQEFWELNRGEETKAQLDIWLAEQETILDMLHWMKNVETDSPEDPLYVSLENGLDLLNESIEKNGFIKDINFNSRVLNEFQPAWGIWANRTFSDSYTKKYWGTVQPYWKDAERLTALIEENEATKIFALYGFRTAVPEFHFTKWKQRVRETLPITSPVLEVLR